MYTKKEINKALQIYDREKSIAGTIKKLGYPTRTTLRYWIKQRALGQDMSLRKDHKPRKILHRKHKKLSEETKYEIIIAKKFSASSKILAKEYGISTHTISKLMAKYNKDLNYRIFIEQTYQMLGEAKKLQGIEAKEILRKNYEDYKEYVEIEKLLRSLPICKGKEEILHEAAGYLKKANDPYFVTARNSLAEPLEKYEKFDVQEDSSTGQLIKNNLRPIKKVKKIITKPKVGIEAYELNIKRKSD